MSFLLRARFGWRPLHGEKLTFCKKRRTTGARPERYQNIKDNLQVKEVIVGDGPLSKRYVLAYNPKEAKQQKEKRDQIISDLNK